MDTTRSLVIGIRVNKDMKNKLIARAIRRGLSLSGYCYQFIYKDLYRHDKTKASLSTTAPTSTIREVNDETPIA